jgi:hypothetical protein
MEVDDRGAGVGRAERGFSDFRCGHRQVGRH